MPHARLVSQITAGESTDDGLEAEVPLGQIREDQKNFRVGSRMSIAPPRQQWVYGVPRAEKCESDYSDPIY
jgi:hypothetical protein